MKNLIALGLASMAAVSSHALPSYDPFVSALGANAGKTNAGTSYTVNTPLWGQTNAFGEGWGEWTGGANNTVNVTNVTLNNFYGGYTRGANFPAVPDQSVLIPDNLNVSGHSACMSFNKVIYQPSGESTSYGAATTNHVYASFLIDIPGPELNTTGIYTFGMVPTNSAGAQTFNGIPSGNSFKFFTESNSSSPNGYFMGPADNGGSGDAAYDTADTGGDHINASYFVVIDYQMAGTNTHGTVTNDYCHIWVNPAPSTFGAATVPAATAGHAVAGGSGLTNIGGFFITARSGTPFPTNGILLGDLRVGTTWSFVTGGPEFVAQPTNIAITAAGQTANFAGMALAGGSAVTYQWQQNGANLMDGGAISGSLTSNLTIINVNATNAGSYTLIATDPIGSVTSSVAIVTLPSPTLTSQPASTNLPPGATAQFNVNASGLAPFSFQWFFNGVALNNGPSVSGSGAVISGATTSNLVVSGVQAGDDGTYSCVVTNAVGETADSTGAVLAVLDPAITSEPQSVTTNYGGTVTFSVGALGSQPLSFQWYDGATPLLANGTSPAGSATVSGGQSPVLSLANVSYLDDGGYSVVVSNALGNSITSSVVTLTVNDPYIAVQPAKTAAAAGSSASFSVTAYGTGPLDYQWYDGSTPLSDGATGTGSAISGSSTATLTITAPSDSDDGNYHVVVTGGSGASATSAPAALLVEDPMSISIYPISRTMAAGSHVGFVIGVIGQAPQYQWSFDGGSISGATNSSLNLSNLTTAASGTYSVMAQNLANSVSASATLVVSNGLLHLAPGNLVVSRVGDGIEPLNNSKGDTLYFDEVQPGGSYVCTVMAPDAVPSGVAWPGPALLALGAGDAIYESMLTETPNQEYINFGAYNLAYPNTNGSVNTGGGYWVRGCAALNGLGYVQLAYTNFGLYSAGNTDFRSVASTDGLTNFWTTGAAGSDGIKFVQAGPGGASYATGNGVPALYSSPAGTRVVQIVNNTVVYSDAMATNVTNYTTSALTAGEGLCAYAGTPEPAFNTGGNTVPFAEILDSGASASPVDFAFSPDFQTVYIADDNTVANGGGIQRWDTNAAAGAPYSWTLSYVIPATASGTNGARGLVVDFSSSSTWGAGSTGAILYATTAAATTNSLVRVTDDGNPDTVTPAWTVLETASTNQLLGGVRFAPQAVGVSITAAPANVATYVGQNVTLSAGVSGDGPYSYQWSFNGTPISGATNATLVLTDVQASQSGAYTLTVSNDISSTSTSVNVSVTTGPPVFTFAPQSRVETAGDHLSFYAVATGTLPISYQWAFNGVNIPGATSSVLEVSNITAANSGTYTIGATNQFGDVADHATLQVTSGLQQLAQANLVASRVGDGVQPLSATNGNTLYIDQFQADGAYVNTIMVPDSTPADVPFPGSAVIAMGGGDGYYQSFLTLSGNSAYINFTGYNVDYPSTNAVNKGLLPGGNSRAILSLDAYGYLTIYTNVGLYSGGGMDIRSAASADGLSEFWTAGSASSPGIKYLQYGANDQNGNGIPAVFGSDTGTRVVQYTPNNNGTVVYTDVGTSPAGLFGANNDPTVATTPTEDISDITAASPNDFAISPDGQTIYVADDGDNGGVQRWDSTGNSSPPYFNLTYTLGTGAASVGARGLSVVFPPSNGLGTVGAVIYATTAETNGNRIITITDNGSSSPATTLVTAGTNQFYIGLRPAPGPTAVQILTQPVSQSVALGGVTTFTVIAGGGPFTYQWSFNGAPLADGNSPTGSGAVISGSLTPALTISNVGLADAGGSFTVAINNPNPNGGASSISAGLTEKFGAASQITVPLGGTATFDIGAAQSGPVTYQWAVNGTNLVDGPSVTGSGATVSGSQSQTLVISDVRLSDEGSYVLTINNANNSPETSSATTLNVTYTPQPPQFNTNGPAATVVPNQGGVELNFSGTADQPYRIWSSTNLALFPVTNTWTLVSQGTFSGGADSFTDPAAATNQATFYVITSP